MKNVASELSRLLEAPALEKQTSQFDVPQICAVTGELIESGYLIKDATTTATNEFMDLFHGTPDGYISEDVAKLLKVQRIGNAAIHDDVLYRPMISIESAQAQGRACWSNLVRQFKNGDEVMLIITTDFKKRLWPMARFSSIGDATTVFVYDTKSSQNNLVCLDWDCFIRVLDKIEEIYAAGFSKITIAKSLFGDNKNIALTGMKKVQKWERELSIMRKFAEFPVANLIAQKPLEIKP